MKHVYFLCYFRFFEKVFDEYSGLTRQDAMLVGKFYRRFEGSYCLHTQNSRSEDEAGISFETSIANCQSTQHCFPDNSSLRLLLSVVFTKPTILEQFCSWSGSAPFSGHHQKFLPARRPAEACSNWQITQRSVWAMQLEFPRVQRLCYFLTNTGVRFFCCMTQNRTEQK